MTYKWFANHCIDLNRIESVSLERAGNYDSTYSIAANLKISFKSGVAIRMAKGAGDGYEEFYTYWVEAFCPKPEFSKVSDKIPA